MRRQLADLANLLLDQGGGTATTGSANAYLLNLPSAPSSYANNLLFVCKLHAAVTGPATINVSGMGVKAFKKLVNGVATDLAAGDGPAGHRPVCIYSSADNAVLMLLAAPTFTQAGSGAISWPIQDRMKEQVYLLDFIPAQFHAGIRNNTVDLGDFDCSDAIEDAMACLTVPHEAGGTVYSGGPEIIFPFGHCYFSRTIEMKKTMIFTGHAQGASNAYSTRLVFPAGITGITVNSLTGFEGDVAPGTPGADGSHIRHLYLDSLSSGVPPVAEWDYEGNVGAAEDPDHWIGHGIWVRGHCSIEHCRVQGFPVHGIYVQASSGSIVSKPWTYGNANLMYIAHCALYANGYDGLYINGPDTNAGLFIGIDANNNGRSGIRDSCLINNTHIGHHADQNARAGMCSYATGPGPGLSRRYICTDEDLAPTIPPEGHAQSRDVWTDWMASPANPDVYSGTPPWPNQSDGITPKAYRQCYPYYFDQTSSGPILIGPYTEASQPSWCSPNSIVIGNMQFVDVIDGRPTYIKPGGTIGHDLKLESRLGSNNEFVTHLHRAIDESLTWVATGDSTSGLAFVFNDADKTWGFRHAGIVANTPLRFTVDNLNAITGGNTVPLDGGHVIFSRGLFLGDTATNNERRLNMGTTAPISQEHAAGEIYLNSAPLMGEPWGWRCILGGTPGTWQALRDMGSQQSITDVAFTLTPGSSPYHTRHVGTMTAARAVTLSTSGALQGLSYRVTRTSGGAFLLNVGTGPLKALDTGQWCEVVYDGSAYYLSAYGAL